MLFSIIFVIFLLPYTVGNRIYAGVPPSWMVYRQEFLISNDDGRNWRTVETPAVAANAIFITDKKIYAGSKGDDQGKGAGLYVTTDEGQIWKQILNYSINSIFVLNDTKFYVATNGGLDISADGGGSWVRKTTADGLGSNNVIAVSSASDTIYVGTVTAGLAISADGGKTWTIKQTAQGLADARVTSVFAMGDNVLVGTQNGLSISKDRGQTWVTKQKGTFDECSYTNYIYSATMSSQNTIYAAFKSGSCLGISSDGGKTWSYKTESDGMNAKGTAMFALGSEVYMGDSNRLSISRDNGSTWITQSIGVSSIFVLSDKATNKLYP